MELKRRIALSAAILSVGLAAGHFVQSRAVRPEPQAAVAEATPTAITQLAAGAGEVAAPAVVPSSLPRLPAQAMALTPDAAAPSGVQVLPAPRIAAPALRTIAGTEAPVAAADCLARLDLIAQTSAMLEVTMVAPCRPGQRVVLKHGGLVITEKTSTTGTLFVMLPALERAASVTVQFPDGDFVEARIKVPDMANYRRFAVQWLADDAFQVHAFEGGADYSTPGHVSAADPRQPPAGVPAKGGFLTLAGNDQVALPMLAEIYTYPARPDIGVNVVVEAAVTAKTCGRELLGETLTSSAGAVIVTDLTVAMPDCAAAGDILVLKNLVPDMKIAAK